MIELYSSATPNGRKVTIMLEELGVKYNTIAINLDKKEQFSEQFSRISPSNKIPVIIDKESKQTIFESGAILLYLAKKYNKFLTNENNLICVSKSKPSLLYPTKDFLFSFAKTLPVN